MTWSPGANEEAGTWSHLWACPAGRGSSLGREVAAAGGMGGEIFLEVAGRQALWHTPSWRFLASMQGGGGGCAARGDEGTSGWRGERGTDSFDFPESGTEGYPAARSWGRRKKGDSSLPSRDSPTDAYRSALKLHTAPTLHWDPSPPLSRESQDSRGDRQRQKSVPAEFGV